MLLQKYKESWVKDFSKIKEIIESSLMGLEVKIEHVGSTAVPELSAKPIIDIDIIFTENGEFAEIKLRLEKLEYYHNGNQGISNREVFKRSKTAVHPILDSITHHLYVCPIDSEELQRHLLFRDYLIADQEARIEYQNLKYEIAEQAQQDKKIYAELKEIKARDFINGIIAKAKRKAHDESL